MAWCPPGVWRGPLLWNQDIITGNAPPIAAETHVAPDAESPAREQPVVDVMPAVLSWPLADPDEIAWWTTRGDDADDGDDDGMHVRGEWRAHSLVTRQALHQEGQEQHNCLRNRDAVFRLASDHTRYWSLRFVPAPGELERLTGGRRGKMRKAQRMLRWLHTTLAVDTCEPPNLVEAFARFNDPVHPVAESALEAWLESKEQHAHACEDA
jgi:hypothetical protein